MSNVSDTTFNDIKRCCRALWATFDDEFGYATEKISVVDRLENVGDNWEYLIAMFDQFNRKKLEVFLDPVTIEVIKLHYPRTFELVEEF